MPVEELAAAVNIVELRELDADGFEGALTTDPNKNKGAILYKAGARKERRRFTIAHELGHFLMPSHKGDEHYTAADLREMRLDKDDRRREAEPPLSTWCEITSIKICAAGPTLCHSFMA